MGKTAPKPRRFGWEGKHLLRLKTLDNSDLTGQIADPSGHTCHSLTHTVQLRCGVSRQPNLRVNDSLIYIFSWHFMASLWPTDNLEFCPLLETASLLRRLRLSLVGGFHKATKAELACGVSGLCVLTAKLFYGHWVFWDHSAGDELKRCPAEDCVLMEIPSRAEMRGNQCSE